MSEKDTFSRAFMTTRVFSCAPVRGPAGGCVPSLSPELDSLYIVFLRHREVVLVRYGGRVAQPLTDDIRGTVLFQFRLAAGTQVLERFWPYVHACTTGDSLEGGPQVLGRLASQHRDNPLGTFVWFEEKCFIQISSSFFTVRFQTALIFW